MNKNNPLYEYADEALLACVKEMSDAECKRVLGSLSLPNGAEEVEEPEDDMDGDLVPDEVFSIYDSNPYYLFNNSNHCSLKDVVTWW